MSAQLDLVGYLDYETFRVMTFRFPMLFYPITRIQQAMRDRVITRPLFAQLDTRTSDIYLQRVVGDRPPLYAVRKLRHYCRLLAFSLCWWRRMRSEELVERVERRERIRLEKEQAKRRRQGGVGGELYEEKRAENDFMRARKRARRMARQRRLAAAGEPAMSSEEEEEEDDADEDVPSAMRRKYFGEEAKADDDPEKIDAIVRRIKDVVHSVSRRAARAQLTECGGVRWLSHIRCPVCRRCVCRRRRICTTATRTARMTSTMNSAHHAAARSPRPAYVPLTRCRVCCPCCCAVLKIARWTSTRMHTSNERRSHQPAVDRLYCTREDKYVLPGKRE